MCQHKVFRGLSKLFVQCMAGLIVTSSPKFLTPWPGECGGGNPFWIKNSYCGARVARALKEHANPLARQEDSMDHGGVLEEQSRSIPHLEQKWLSNLDPQHQQRRTLRRVPDHHWHVPTDNYDSDNQMQTGLASGGSETVVNFALLTFSQCAAVGAAEICGARRKGL